MQERELAHTLGSGKNPAVGPTAIGPYRLERELGHGTDGVVYLARRVGAAAPVALKVLRSGSLDEEGRARFEREAAVMRALDHPGVVRLLEAGTHAGHPWYAMEYCAGPTLQQRLRQGPFEPRAAVALALALAQALARAHAMGVVHRDLKPANVILEEGTARPRVADFGLAKWWLGDSLTRTGDVLGTPAYMAPEQFDDSKRVDDRADVWALGVILYECLSGSRPFESASVPEHAALLRSGPVPPPLSARGRGIDRRLDQVCRRALARNPAERPAAGELAVALAGWLSADPLPERGGERRRRVALAAGALGLAGLGALAGWLAVPSAPPAPRPTPGEPAPAASERPAEPAREDPAELRRALAAPRPWDPALERRVRRALAADPDLELDLAEWLCWRGRPREALDLLATAGADGPRRERRAILIGWCHALLADLGPDHVQRPTEELLARCDDTPAVRAALGLVVMHRNEHRREGGVTPEAERAVDLAIEATARDPASLLAQALLINAGGLRVRERIRERAASLRAELLRHPDDVRALLGLGLVALRLGDPARAYEALLRAHELLGGRAHAFSTLNLLAQLSRERDELEALAAILEPAADEPEGSARLERMDLRRRRGDEAGARVDLARLLLRPDAFVKAGQERLRRDAELLGWADRTLGTEAGGGLLAWPEEVPRCADSPALAARAAAAAPEARAGLLEALRAAAGGAPPDELERLLDRMRGDDPAVAWERARLSVGRDLDRAEEAIERARALAPERRSELELLLALRHLRRGRWSQAREALARLAADPSHGAAASCAAAELALLDDDPTAARAAAERALELDPTSLAATVALARALVSLDPRAADQLVDSSIRERWGFEDARLASAGVELAARARLFAIAVVARWARAEGAALAARQRRLESLTRAAWVSVQAAHAELEVTPFFARFEAGLARSRQALERVRAQEPGRADLLLCEGALALTVHTLDAAPPAPVEPVLEAWRRALRAEPGLVLPPAWADRFARQHPQHAWLVAWRAEEPRRELEPFLSERLRAR